MRKFCILTVLFLAAGICSLAAQDLIVMRDGSMIESRVVEISQTEIRYKRFDHLDGPTIVIPAGNVLSIRYENGRQQTISAAPAWGNPSQQARPQQPRNQAARHWNHTAIDPDRFIFAFNINPFGFVNMVFWGATGSGGSLSFEFGKGNFNSEISLMFPGLGFGFLATFNGFWHNRIGGWYFGGGLGYSFYEGYDYISGYYDGNNRWVSGYDYWFLAHSFTLGLNGGHKFVTRSGFYTRIGAFVGFDFGYIWNDGWTLPVYFKPEITIGWTMR